MLDRVINLIERQICLLHRSISSHCFGSTMSKHPSRCLRVSGECGSASARQRPLRVLASSCTSLNSTALNSNFISHRFVFILTIYFIVLFYWILIFLIMNLKAQQQLCFKPYKQVKDKTVKANNMLSCRYSGAELG